MNTYRYEIKFIVPGQFSHTIDHAIKLNPAMFTKIYEPRYINNIYFDNNLTKYMENIDGISNRKKIRIRWYGDFFGHVKTPVLEIKEKKSMLINKRSYSFPSFDTNSSINIKNMINYKISDNKQNYQFLKLMESTVVNRYNRRYFLSKIALYPELYPSLEGKS